jgi:hypothetical protein
VFSIERQSGEAEEEWTGCLFVCTWSVYDGLNRKCYPYVEAQYDRAEDKSVL